MLFIKEAERIRQEVRDHLFRVSEQRQAAEQLYRRTREDEEALEQILSGSCDLGGLIENACPHCFVWLGANNQLVQAEGADLQLRFICHTCCRGFDRRFWPRGKDSEVYRPAGLHVVAQESAA